ncbi:hypothetical protein G6F46_014397 [Rhizopus delemar]|nr:hypothetical protein G6F46_014397 [Rhizopus delemar]
MPMQLQPVTPSHYARIARWLDSAAATQRWAGPGVAFPVPAGAFAQVLGLGTRPGRVLLDGQGDCVGFGQYWLSEPGTTHLGRIIVSPQARGRGLGRVLMQLMIAEALQSPGVQRLTLRVYRDNAAAVALYRDFGVQPVDDASTPDLLFMQRGGG